MGWAGEARRDLRTAEPAPQKPVRRSRPQNAPASAEDAARRDQSKILVGLPVVMVDSMALAGKYT